MMPKDLLEFLETGDRTMEDLKGGKAPDSPTNTLGMAAHFYGEGLSAMMSREYMYRTMMSPGQIVEFNRPTPPTASEMREVARALNEANVTEGI